MLVVGVESDCELSEANIKANFTAFISTAICNHSQLRTPIQDTGSNPLLKQLRSSSATILQLISKD